MTEPDLSEPVHPGGEARGVGESLDAPAADVPPVDELPPGEHPIGESPAQAAPVSARPTVRAPEVTVVEIVDEPGPREVTMRRAPRYRAFVGTGAIIGVVLAVLLIALFPDDGRFSTASVLGYLAVSLGLVGGLLGGAVAVLVERPHRSR